MVNAITHRNYGYSGDYIRISIFVDRMEIQSLGKLPNLVTVENMRHMRWSRNPVIVRTLIEFGWVRELNEGVGRIYDEMQGLFLDPPEFTEPNNASVMLTLKNNIETRSTRKKESLADRMGDGIYGELSEYEHEALQYVFVRGCANVVGLAEHMGRSVKVSRSTLKSLVKKGLLVWHGTSAKEPSQYYTLW